VNAGKASKRNRPYKNRHDLAAQQSASNNAQTGENPPSPNATRERIDTALAYFGSFSRSDLYYAAAELNGAGIRYYGDLCLVLKQSEVLSDTKLLDRNSFDLSRSPIRERIAQDSTSGLASTVDEVKRIAGAWAADVCDMAICKIMDGGRDNDRLLTTGTISAGLLNDEDYLEVLRIGSFGADDLEEVRVAAVDAGTEGRVADRLSRGPTPSQTELLWRHRRRHADRALAAAGVRSRVVVTAGRARV
jgi:hypothetical protein